MGRLDVTVLGAFLDIAANQSFRRAAEIRGVSPSALSHAMRTLEEQVGVRLLNRTTRSVSLTEAGESFVDRIAPALRELDLAVDELGQFRDSVRGRVRINAPEAGARLLVTQVVPSVRQRYPELEVDIMTSGSLVDIIAEGFDAGVRLGETVPRDMIAVPITGDIRFRAVAAPKYLAARGRPETPDALKDHECIRQRLPSGTPYRWEFAKDGQEIAVDVPGLLTLNDSGLMAKVAADGLGIAYLPDVLIQDLLDDGRLVAVLDDWSPSLPGLYLYYAGHRRVPAPLRAFIDVMKDVIR